MWLTGFDCPALNTMYADKPMKGHGLMQAIARVNRVFRDKPGGLVVDYFGLGYELKKALDSYRDGGGTGPTKPPPTTLAVPPTYSEGEVLSLLQDRMRDLPASSSGTTCFRYVAARGGWDNVSLRYADQNKWSIESGAWYWEFFERTGTFSSHHSGTFSRLNC
jgi:hypothetical protein